MAEPIINQIDIATWLRKARRNQDPVAYLDALNDQATNAVAAGDEYVTITTDEGGMNTAERKVESRFLQHVTEMCLQTLEAQLAAGGADNLPPPGAVRYGDFSGRNLVPFC
jgi:hypothetical protein